MRIRDLAFIILIYSKGKMQGGLMCMPDGTRVDASKRKMLCPFRQRDTF